MEDSTDQDRIESLESVLKTLRDIEERITKLEKELTDWKEQRIPLTEQVKTEQIGITHLLRLPDHLRESLIVISDLEQATANQVAEKTGRVRNLESSYLNQLERMGMIERFRDGRKVYFRVPYVRGPAVRRVLEQLYKETRGEENTQGSYG